MNSGKMVDITFWPETTHLLADNIKTGDIIAITATTATENMGMYI